MIEWCILDPKVLEILEKPVNSDYSPEELNTRMGNSMESVRKATTIKAKTRKKHLTFDKFILLANSK
ncbi:hypothetical protein [Bartonella sp. JB63]|uniref:hypothetical protein n=1 Tax=Bartonella sp. JB63 TaxID=1933907 RepID=UPI000999FCFD|nr:hypothetical protein [Bartonella sp. JB63]